MTNPDSDGRKEEGHNADKQNGPENIDLQEREGHAHR